MKNSCDINNRKKQHLKNRKMSILRHYKMIFSYVFHKSLLFEENTYMSQLHLHILATNYNKGQNKHKGKLHSSKVTAQHYDVTVSQRYHSTLTFKI